jgi:fermentation-respiration switch protein FrsA (DUF1100 family)
MSKMNQSRTNPGSPVRSRLIFFIAFILLLGCDHVFYHPSQEMVDSPEKYGVKYEEFSISTRDNETLKGWRLYSKRKVSYGTFVQFHGNAENMSTHFRSLAWVTDAGFDLVVFDYRGYGKSTGRPERSLLVDDGKLLLEWVLKNSKTPDVILVGQSLGGTIVVPVLSKAPSERVRLLVLDSTFESYRTITREKLSAFFLTWPFQYPLSYLVSDSLSPADYISTITTPILFLHSKADPIVSYNRGYSLYKSSRSSIGFWDFETPSHTAGFHIPELNYREKLIELVCSLATLKDPTCGKDD